MADLMLFEGSKRVTALPRRLAKILLSAAVLTSGVLFTLGWIGLWGWVLWTLI